MFCKNCNKEVKEKLDVSWLVIIVTALLFWPATAVYLVWKYLTHAYVCPVCNIPMEAEK